MQTVYWMVLKQTCFEYCAFWQKSRHVLMQKEKKNQNQSRLNDFIFALLLAIFRVAGVASMAVKGLRLKKVGEKNCVSIVLPKKSA